MILIHCILESSSGSDLNYTSIDTIRRKFVCESRADSQVKSYLFGYERDNPSYEFLKTSIFGDHSEIHSTEEPTVYTKNLLAAKEFFDSKLSAMPHSKIEETFTKVTQQLVFNVYEISKDIDVFVAFETMNNRGKPLSALELLKNRLIFLAVNGVEAEAGDNARLRKLVNEAWKTVYHNLGRNQNRPLQDDAFLFAHLCYFYHAEVDKSLPSDDDAWRAYGSYFFRVVMQQPEQFLLGDLFTRKRQSGTRALPEVSPAFIKLYADDLKRSADIYFKMSTPEASNFSEFEKITLERIARLRGNDPSAVMLAVFLREKGASARGKFLEAYERFLFIWSFRQSTRHPLEGRAVPPEVVRFIKGNLALDELVTFYRNAADQFFKETPVADVLEEWVKQGLGYYGHRSIRFFLYEYELHLMELSKSSRRKIKWEDFVADDYGADYRTVEHIYPQRARDPYWVDRFRGFSVPHRSLLRNSLGNLLALSVSKNASLSNKAFPVKVGDGTPSVGYRFGGYSENEVATFSEWGAEQIAERGIRMLDFMERRWSIPIGDRDQKLKALGNL